MTTEAVRNAAEFGTAPTTPEGWVDRAREVATRLSVDAVARDRAARRTRAIRPHGRFRAVHHIALFPEESVFPFLQVGLRAGGRLSLLQHQSGLMPSGSEAIF